MMNYCKIIICCYWCHNFCFIFLVASFLHVCPWWSRSILWAIFGRIFTYTECEDSGKSGSVTVRAQWCGFHSTLAVEGWCWQTVALSSQDSGCPYECWGFVVCGRKCCWDTPRVFFSHMAIEAERVCANTTSVIVLVLVSDAQHSGKSHQVWVWRRFTKKFHGSIPWIDGAWGPCSPVAEYWNSIRGMDAGGATKKPGLDHRPMRTQWLGSIGWSNSFAVHAVSAPLAAMAWNLECERVWSHLEPWVRLTYCGDSSDVRGSYAAEVAGKTRSVGLCRCMAGYRALETSAPGTQSSTFFLRGV